MARRKPKKSEMLEIRVTYEDKQSFMQACQTEGISASDKVRSWIRLYIGAANLKSWIGYNKEKKMYVLAPTMAAVMTLGVTNLVGSTETSMVQETDTSRNHPAFSRMDLDEDGRFSRTEFSHFMAEKAEHADRRIDERIQERISDNAELTSEEEDAVQAVRGLGTLVAGMIGREMFNAYDVNRDGFLTEEEMRENPNGSPT